MNRRPELIERLVAKPEADDVDALANELLLEYQRGSSVESLRVLLSSANDRLVGVGVWIASELGDLGMPLLRDIGKLLAHPSKRVRFWAIDCVHICAGQSDGSELASAVALIDDADEAVRWKAMGFLSRTSREQLQAALAHLTATNPNSPYVDELEWLLGGAATDGARVVAGLYHDNSRRRKFAAAAASRIAEEDREPLHYAASADDPEIAQFARDMLQMITAS